MRPEYPKAGDIPALKELWQDTFGDDAAFIGHFFSSAFHPSRCRVLRREGPVSALYWLDAACRGKRIAYLYAFATRKDCRGQGLGRTLLADTLALLKAEGYSGAILVPGEEGLVPFYMAAGFDKWVAGGNPGPAEVLQPVTPECYLKKRQAFLSEGAVQQQDPAFLSHWKLYAGETTLLAQGLERLELGTDPGKNPPRALYCPLDTAPPPRYFGLCYD